MALSKNLGENVNDIITDMDNHNNFLQQLCRISASILTGVKFDCVESIKQQYSICPSIQMLP